MKTIKVSEATGPALDWLVAKCEGLNPNSDPEARRQYVGYPGFAEGNGFGYAIKNYSTDWAQGGSIIEREIDALYRTRLSTTEVVYEAMAIGDSECMGYGHTPLTAAMRCYVASKLGETAEVPEELL